MSIILVELASPPDREHLVAQLMCDNEQLAEVNSDSGILIIELYGRQDGKAWSFDYESLISALAKAKQRLSNR